MNRLILWFAYFLVFTTPIQIFFCLWVYSFLLSPEYSLLSFSTADFFDLTFFKPIKTWFYSWFWNAFLDFVWSLPAALISTLKLVINTWLGFWLLPIAKNLNTIHFKWLTYFIDVLSSRVCFSHCTHGVSKIIRTLLMRLC